MVRYNTDGSLDGTFGTGGIVRTQASDPLAPDPDSEADRVVVQADGKLVVVGDGEEADGSTASAVVRYNTDGSLDTTFGPAGTGIVVTQAADPTEPNGNSNGESVAIQADGKIVVAGAAESSVQRQFALVPLPR